MFSSKKFLHYVFAEQTDEYFTKGLLRFQGLQDYLTFLLKTAGYEDTFFVSGRKSMQVATMKEDALKAGFFDLFSKVESRDQLYYMNMNPDKFWRWMKNRLMKEKKQAFVFYLKEFVNFFSARDREVYLKECIRFNQEYGGSAEGNIIVLYAGMEAGDSQPYFVDPQGIFQQRTSDGACLDSILADITDPSRDLIPLYQEMRKEMANQVYFFNDNKAATIETILKRKQLYQNQYVLSAADRKEMAWMIYYLMHVHSLRIDTGIDYIKPRMTHKELLTLLENEAKWRHLKSKLEELQASYQRMGRPFLAGMKEDYLAHAMGQECMIASSLLMNKAREISLEKLNMFPSEKESFKACIHTMETIWNKSINREVSTWLLRFLERLHKEENQENRDSVRVLVKAVESSVRLLTVSSDCITDAQLQNLENYEIWLKKCDELNELIQEISNLNQLREEQEYIGNPTEAVDLQLKPRYEKASNLEKELEQTEPSLYISSVNIVMTEAKTEEKSEQVEAEETPGLSDEELKDLLNVYNY